MADIRSPDAVIYRQRSAWRRLRAAQLASEPHCAMCRAMGRTTPATIADHNQPHRGDAELFFDPDNLVSLCAPHHDATKQRLERGRSITPLLADGWPG